MCEIIAYLYYRTNQKGNLMFDLWNNLPINTKESTINAIFSGLPENELTTPEWK